MILERRYRCSSGHETRRPIAGGDPWPPIEVVCRERIAARTECGARAHLVGWKHGDAPVAT